MFPSIIPRAHIEAHEPTRETAKGVEPQSETDPRKTQITSLDWSSDPPKAKAGTLLHIGNPLPRGADLSTEGLEVNLGRGQTQPLGKP